MTVMRMSWTRSIVLAGVCAAPLALVAQTAPKDEPPAAAAAEQPARSQAQMDRPAKETDDRLDSRNDAPPGGRWRGDGDDRERRGREPRDGESPDGELRDGAPDNAFHPLMDFPSREEWEKFVAFMKENSPKRWSVVENSSNPDGQMRMRGMLYQRFRVLERLRNADQDMYEVNLRRIGVEDEIFDISYSALLTEGRPLTPQELSKLREQVTALVDITIEEREVRVQRLRDMLKREEGLLTVEKGQREAAIAERMALIEQGDIMRGGGMRGGLRPRRDGDRFPGAGGLAPRP